MTVRQEIVYRTLTGQGRGPGTAARYEFRIGQLNLSYESLGVVRGWRWVQGMSGQVWTDVAPFPLGEVYFVVGEGQTLKLVVDTEPDASGAQHVTCDSPLSTLEELWKLAG